MTGLENTFVMQLPKGEFWTTRPELHQKMFVGNVHGGTLVFRRELLELGIRYPEINLAEDAWLLQRTIKAGKRLMRLSNPGVFVYVRHGRNAWHFNAGDFLNPDGWLRIPTPIVFPEGILSLIQSCGQRTLTGATGGLVLYRDGGKTMNSIIETSRASETTDDNQQAVGHGHSVWLDTLPLTESSVGYGELGRQGSLGYEGKQVIVAGQRYHHALSAHPPSSLVFQAEGRFNHFKCRVALDRRCPPRQVAGRFHSVWLMGIRLLWLLRLWRARCHTCCWPTSEARGNWS